MKDLTDRQQQLLLFIEDHVQTRGFPPSIREMADSMGIHSTNGVNDHLKALERKGYIVRGKDLKSRAISITQRFQGSSSNSATASAVQIPILGRVAAGMPTFSEENFEGQLCWDRSLLPMGKNLFALRVRGESMIEKGIFDGDLVIVKAQQTAESGQIVVILIDGEATVKTFRDGKNSIRLEPANSKMIPIVVHKKDFRTANILGVVTGVYRQIQ